MTQPEGRYHARLSSIMELEDAVVSSANLNTVIQKILDTTGHLMYAQITTLRLLDEENQTLKLAAVSGLKETDGFYKAIERGESVVGRAVQERRPFPVPDIRNSPFKNMPFAESEGLRSLISIPLMAKEKVLGGITVYSRIPHAYDEEEIHLLSAIAGLAAIAIENSKLFRDTLNTLVSLNTALEARDPYTRGHSARVERYCVELATELRLPTPVTATVEQMAALHDIGKVGVSEAILNKPGRLNPKERKAIQQHSQIGETILKPIKMFDHGSKIIRWHHEWWSGKGYPDALRGQEIPIESRIISIADAYDSMTTKRCYHDPVQVADALAEIRKCAGTQFDPNIVAIFHDLLTSHLDEYKERARQANLTNVG